MTTVKKVRDTNIELFRIFLMLMIIAHHYVYHSGVPDLYNYDHVTGNQLFLILWGWGGKTGINCFLLITGYFMCMQRFTWKKFLKLYLEIKFYSLLIPVIFWAIGRQPLTFKYCIDTLFGVAIHMSDDFAPTFLALFLLIPFINILIDALDKKNHLRLLLALLFIFTVTSSFFNNQSPNQIGWYVTVYLIGAYLRKYPPTLLSDVKKSTWLAVVSLSLCAEAILFFVYTKHRLAFSNYFLVADSNKILAILAAVSLFCMFKSINMGQIRWVNQIATATFGIFLIHDQPNVREWLWNDVFCAKDYFTSDCLWLHAICAMLVVYVACAIIDILRQRLLEKPFFTWLDNKFPRLNQ